VERPRRERTDEGRELPARGDPADPAQLLGGVDELEDLALGDVDRSILLGLMLGIEVRGEDCLDRWGRERVLEAEGGHGASIHEGNGQFFVMKVRTFAATLL